MRAQIILSIAFFVITSCTQEVRKDDAVNVKTSNTNTSVYAEAPLDIPISEGGPMVLIKAGSEEFPKTYQYCKIVNLSYDELKLASEFGNYLFVSNMFRTSEGITTALHTLESCPSNFVKKGADVALFPSTNNFNSPVYSMAKPEEGNMCMFNGVKMYNTETGELRFKLTTVKGTLVYKEIQKTDKMPGWERAIADALRGTEQFFIKCPYNIGFKELGGLSGSPALNHRGEVVGLFSGIINFDGEQYLLISTW